MSDPVNFEALMFVPGKTEPFKIRIMDGDQIISFVLPILNRLGVYQEGLGYRLFKTIEDMMRSHNHDQAILGFTRSVFSNTPVIEAVKLSRISIDEPTVAVWMNGYQVILPRLNLKTIENVLEAANNALPAYIPRIEPKVGLTIFAHPNRYAYIYSPAAGINTNLNSLLPAEFDLIMFESMTTASSL